MAWKDMAPALALCAFLLVGGLATGLGQEEPDSDEPVYLAMAAHWAGEGEAPHEDFFCAHPPGLLAPAAILYALAPPSIRTARIVPLLATLALFFFTLASARVLERRCGLSGATLFASTFLVTSPLLHLVGASYLGVSLFASLCAAALWTALLDRPGLSGLLVASSLFVRLSGFPVLVALAFFFRRRPRFFFGAAIGAFPLAFCFLLQPGCFDQTVLYHLDKQSMFFGARLGVLLDFLYEEKVVLLFSVPALFLLRRKPATLFLASGFLALLFAAAQKVVWLYYFHLAVPCLAVAGGAWAASLFRGRLEGKFLVFPNMVLLLAAGAANVFLIAPRYRPDETLLPLVEKAEALTGGEGKVLDLSGGGKGPYLACKTRLDVAENLFDMSLQRYGRGRIDGPRLANALRRKPDLVLTEIEAGAGTILWSRLPETREALLGLDEGEGFRPRDIHLRPNDLSLIVLWVPADRERPAPPAETLEMKERSYRFWYVTPGPSPTSKAVVRKGNFVMGSTTLMETVLALPDGPGLLAARGVFCPPEYDVSRWRAEDRRKGRTVESCVWAQPEGERLLIETVYAGETYDPVSFAEARFDPASKTLAFLRIYGDVGRGFVPVLSVRPAD